MTEIAGDEAVSSQDVRSGHKVIITLGKDLMYQLSTAGQELFHSNMLFWLATNAPDASAPIWEMFGLETPTAAFREYQKVDLYVTSAEGHLFLENKVMALPDAEQLARYAEKLEKQGFGDNARWILLTLIPPVFDTSRVGSGRWRCVSYADLLPALRQTVDALEGSDRALAARYAEMAAHLVELAGEYDPQRDLDSPFWLEATLQESLEAARLASVVKKLQMARCAELIRERLNAAGERPDGARVDAGMSARSKGGIVQHFIEYKSGRVTRKIGWQLEGRQLRLVGILGDKEWRRIDPDKRGQILEEENEGYFSFKEEFEQFSELLEPYPGKREWLQYGEQFRYRYSTVKEQTTWSRLIDLLTHASERAYRQTAHAGR
ncbi:PD-(D/E)XK nuclease family protein [Dietzia massiliensis]|uniref:PD-(D/E)XK nuclease family protein n=1 Tax=Dietzia massiliensis TaxID=2697499 RepID=UPI001BCD81AD|nr:PD-(D/E)XK nuclease family protein [Dietzia massiliensis]MBS7549414.1 PD-(D/E)XK nuclease family protein [Dietzia massiliensis]